MNEEIILKPIVSEKSVLSMKRNKYSFEVRPNSNKIEIAKAVENAFNVRVKSVNIINLKGKRKMFRGIVGEMKKRKKAVVTLKEGDKIQIFEGT